MGSVSGEETVDLGTQDSSAHEERIFVSIRLRPLNERELGKNDVSDWDCINSTTIIFKNSFQERSMHPAAYTFDRVFGPDCHTRQVYEECAKKIALSVLSGMNSSIFAYGQTSSGKTYTMSGITHYAIEDIFEYISKHHERNFVLRFSAMEIYNESVRDLISTDGAHLRLLDDPERGTIVDKLTEVTLRDSSHLKELLSVCESQRQVGETTLNELSSRSHQILRLTVESEACRYLGAENASTLTASVNFVDLAGSERASQTMSAGTRLKEGSHINRSLLTLGTVIRKLSKGRNGHVPYRDSKLTRILQHSLGGNARTAIICTMSPAHGHVEQSRNTLLFASCAKQVSTNARVNVVMSEKALVKHLQRELARLENELRNLSSLAGSCDSASALQEKEYLIQKMDKEIRDLTYQRDFAQSRVDNVLRSGGEYTPSKSWVEMNNHKKGSWTDDYPASETSEIIDPLRFDAASSLSHFSDRYESRIEDPFPDNNEEQFLSNDISPRLYIDKYFGPDPCKGWEKTAQVTGNLKDNCKEVQCIEIDFTKRNTEKSNESSPQNRDQISGQSPTSSEEDISDPSTDIKRSKSCAAILTTMNKSPDPEEEKENGDSCKNEGDNQGEFSSEEPPDPAGEDQCPTDSQSSTNIDVMNDEVKEENTEIMGEDLIADIQQVTETKLAEVIKSDVMKQIEDPFELEKPVNNPEEKDTDDDVSKKSEDIKPHESDWSAEFDRQKKEIIELWDTCNIPLLHRTYFFLMFKGEPSDGVYMEVERRRLSFLKNSLHGVGINVRKDDKQASRSKALNQEREMLSKRMLKKFPAKERESMFKNWGIDLKSKQRRVQLCRKLWTNTKDMEHIKESASIVAKLVGFMEPGRAPKEMFGLSFLPKPENARSSSWRHSLPSIA